MIQLTQSVSKPSVRQLFTVWTLHFQYFQHFILSAFFNRAYTKNKTTLTYEKCFDFLWHANAKRGDNVPKAWSL